MSLRSWKKEFYPISAVKAARGTMLESLQHCLCKWTGLRPDALTRHKLKLDYGGISDGTSEFDFDFESCALCVRFHDEDQDSVDCDRCPLFAVRKCTCDVPIRGEEYSPYRTGIYNDDPEPMIRLIEKVIARELRRTSKRSGDA
jgi:hypothetical protein